MRRRVSFAHSALEYFRKCNPNRAEIDAVFNAIDALTVDPSQGILLYYPGVVERRYQFDVGRFQIVYSFTSREIKILFVGD